MREIFIELDNLMDDYRTNINSTRLGTKGHYC